MKQPRVKRSAGPKSKMTEATYRKKALPHLLQDFQGLCAYCLDPSEFRHPSLSQVDHFDCKLRGRQRHHYANLMLACAACNLSKHDKPVKNQFDSEQRLLNCTKEDEFPEHVAETDDGQWRPLSKAGEYHLQAIGLTEACHKMKRQARKQIANQVLAICTMALNYETSNPMEIHNQIMDTIQTLLAHLENFPPLVTSQGVVSTRDWLMSQGMDVGIFADHRPTQPEVE